MMRVTFLALILLPLFVFSQGESNIWHFGYRCGLNFNGDTVKIDTSAKVGHRIGCATISDKNGNLLFYSFSEFIVDRNHNIMKNGLITNGSVASTQGALIVPKNNHEFYVFTTGTNGVGPLSYSIVDMNKNSGLGEVVLKDQVLMTNTAEKVTAIKHLNGRDYWVIAHGVNNTDFNIWRVTSERVVTPAMIQKVGFRQNVPANVEGYLKFNQSGTLLFNAYPGIGAELFSFDASTGKMTKLFTLNQPGVYGGEFSANDSILYVSTWDAAYTGSIYQFDLSSMDSAKCNQSKTFLGKCDGLGGALQMSPKQDVIYLGKLIKSGSKRKIDYLGVINHPDSLGLACNFQDSGFYMGAPAAVGLGLPNFSPSLIQNPFFQISDRCRGDSVIFKINYPENADSVVTNIGGIAVLSFDSLSKDFKLKLDTIGKVLIDISVYEGSKKIRKKELFQLFQYPEIELGQDTSICPGKSVSLDVTQTGFVQYKWQNNSGVPVHRVTKPGLYHVAVTEEVCTSRDTINVSFFNAPIAQIVDTSICPYDSIEFRIEADSILWFDHVKSLNRIFHSSGQFSYQAWKGQCVVLINLI